MKEACDCMYRMGMVGGERMLRVGTETRVSGFIYAPT